MAVASGLYVLAEKLKLSDPSKQVVFLDLETILALG